MNHFNGEIENLGETLFGEDANPKDFKNFAKAFEENEQNGFLHAVKESFLIDCE